MYTVTQLANLYKVSRNTIYTKLKHKSLNEYITKGSRGEPLIYKEGLNLFQILLSESKAAQQQINNNKTLTKQAKDTVNSQCSDNAYKMLIEQYETRLEEKDRIISMLESQIQEKNKQYNDVFEHVLSYFAQQRLLTENKKNIFKNVVRNLFKNKKSSE